MSLLVNLWKREREKIKTDKKVCPKCGKPARTGVGLLADGKKVRVCKNCNEMLTTNE